MAYPLLARRDRRWDICMYRSSVINLIQRFYDPSSGEVQRLRAVQSTPLALRRVFTLHS